MNTTKKLQQAKLDQWAVLCKEQSESGLTVKQWCEQNGYTIHTYNYWKHRLKKAMWILFSRTSFLLLHSLLLHYTNCAIRVLTARSLSHFVVSASLSTLQPLTRCSAVSSQLCAMLRDADPSSFSAIYVVCGYTDMRYGMDTLSAIIETRYPLPLFVPNTLFLFCGRCASRIKGLLWEGGRIPSLYQTRGRWSFLLATQFCGGQKAYTGTV